MVSRDASASKNTLYKVKTKSYVTYWGSSSLRVRMIDRELNRVKVFQRYVVLQMKKNDNTG